MTWILKIIIAILLITIFIMLGYMYSLRQMVIALSGWIKDNTDKPLQTVWEECYDRAARSIKETDLDSRREILRKQLRGVWRVL